MTTDLAIQLAGNVAAGNEHLTYADRVAALGSVGATLRRDVADARRWRVVVDGLGLEDADADVFEVLDVVALEVYGLRRVTSSDRFGGPLVELVIVTGLGGPHVETRIEESGRGETVGYWGDAEYRLPVDLPELAAALWDLFEVAP